MFTLSKQVLKKLKALFFVVIILSFAWLGTAFALSSIYPDAVLVPLSLDADSNHDDASVKMLKFFIRPSIANIKLRYTGLEGCNSSLGVTDPSNSMINTLVILNEHLKNKVGVQNYIKEYLVMGCDINSTESFGYTPLHNAVLAKDFKMVKFLLSHDANRYSILEKAGSKVDGLNVIEFADLLYESNPSDNLNKIKAILNSET